MPSATVEVQFVNPPKEGYSSGSIKAKFPDGSSQYVDVNADQLSQFVKGGTYCIFWLDKTRKTSGKVYKQFQELVSDGRDGPPKQAPTAPQKPNGGMGSKPSQEMGMFVMGCVGRAMGSGMFKAEDVYELTVAARTAWEGVMEGNIAAQQRPIIARQHPDVSAQMQTSPFDDPPPPTEDDYGARE